MAIFCIMPFYNIAQIKNVPPNPQIDSISILNENPIIRWVPNTGNTTGYTIYRGRIDQFSQLIFDSLDSRFNILDDFYIDNTITACETQQLYKVSAFNETNSSNWLFADTLKTMLLFEPTFDVCANTIILEWTAYLNMQDELNAYRILASFDSVNFFLVGTSQPGETVFNHDDLEPDRKYYYKIRATNQDGSRTSTTCIKSISSRTYPRPDFTNIITATVEDNSFIRLDWDADQTAPILRFDIERRAANETTFSIVNSFENDSTYNPPTLLDDPTAEFNAQSYEYRVVMWDSCGQNPVYSQISRTIHLSGEPFPDYTNRLQWNHYEGWDIGVAEYNIYRATDNNFVLLNNVPGFTNDYSDNVSAFSGTGGVFTYYVEAIEEGGNNAISKSNHIVLEMETRVETPNAFIPGALPPDNEFKPQVSFIADGSYELMIFNKWGQMIFTTRDTEQGWDGRVNGELQPPGAYVYLIKYRTPEGQNMEKRGTVTILR
jgi:gliding motility-associated-like protein